MDIAEIVYPGSELLPRWLGGLLSSTRGVVEVDSTGKVTLEIRKPRMYSHEQSIEIFKKVQWAYGGIGKIYKKIETVAGKGLFVANDDDAI